VRIGFNALCISPDYKGGVNSFVFGLIDAFARVGGVHEFVIFVNPPSRLMFEKYKACSHFRIIETNEAGNWQLYRAYHRVPWQVRYRLPMPVNKLLTGRCARMIEREADVHFVPFCPPPLFPFPRVPTLYSIHDIQHMHYPEFFTPRQLLERKLGFGRCIAHATTVQASSRYMLRDFLEYFPTLKEEQVCVIREGVDIGTFAEPGAVSDVKAKYRLPAAFLFYPAQLWHHKNHLTVLRALRRLHDRNIEIPLVLTGARYEASQNIFDFIEQSALASQVFYLGLVPFDDLVALYQAARLLITAVLYESSSIPILEAAAAGTAIIASRTPPNQELAEHLEMQLFSPTDDADLADLLASAWNNEALIARQVKANKAGIRRFSWDNAARDYLKALESIGARR
jgi:glycosyltransferase involved in cell wall biosynthesis